MNKIKIFCVTDVQSKLLEELDLILIGVGKRKFNKRYIDIKNRDNIQNKEKHYSELTFHYWFWKNKLSKFNKDTWIGFSQKRRFWLKKNCKINKFKDLKDNLLKEAPNEWKNYQSILCKPVSVSDPKKMKIIKRGLKNLIKDPSIFFKKDKQNIKLHFDMHHGYGIIDKAIDVMNMNDKEQFRKYINTKTKFNPNIMYISKKIILNKWFKDLFHWLLDCEKIFGFQKLSGYDQQRLYAYLAERYASFWFKKYSKHMSWHWTFFDTINKNL
tara:strand:+ start:3543 stop:4352 length:810 start_codon:yes stop_codon:yes gene_type:complete